MPKQAVLVVTDDQAFRDLLLRLVNDGKMSSSDLPNILHSVVDSPSRGFTKHETVRSGSSIDECQALLVVTSPKCEPLAIQAVQAASTAYHRVVVSRDLFQRDCSPYVSAALPKDCPSPMLGVSEKVKELRRYLDRVAVSSCNVLITGETGTGKELAAEMIHRQSARSGKQMVTLNCAALPDSLIESELFGYEKGSFTGAYAAREGKLKLADGGTIFLDEVGDLSPFAQAKLLRTIERGELQRLGGGHSERIDVRFIAATNKNLEGDTNFRQDLFFRLNVARVHIPPLRERREDVLMLADSFRREFEKTFACWTRAFTTDAQQLLIKHQWPGNIRELRNVVESSFIDPGLTPTGELHTVIEKTSKQGCWVGPWLAARTTGARASLVAQGRR
jgi:transcriptional regulator with GAF, ATPase, and Fis domain